MDEITDGRQERAGGLGVVATYFRRDERGGALHEHVYRALRQAILAGDLQSGDKIAEQEVAKLLPVSRTPIREAFRRLEAEQLVAPSPSRGVVVRGVTFSDLADLYEVLEPLEALAARLAATRISEDALSRLKRTLELLIFFTERERWEERTEQAVAFHDIIYEASGNPRLCALIRSLREHAHSFRRFHLRTPTVASRGIEEHVGIYEALAARDAVAAAAIMSQHVGQSRRLVEELRASVGQTPSDGRASWQAALPVREPAIGIAERPASPPRSSLTERSRQ